MQQLGQLLRGAVGLHHQGRLVEAEQLYAKVLEADAKQFDALHLLGLLKHQRGDSAQALQLIESALDINPKSVDALLNYAGVLTVMKRHDDALASYDRALALELDRADVYFNRGNALMRLNRLEEALAAYDRALALKPNDLLILFNRGNALAGLDRFEEALAIYDRALAMAPNHADPEVHIYRGRILTNLKRFEEALACFDRALALRPGDATALSNRGDALNKLYRYQEALVCYDRVLEINPEDADTHLRRGNILHALNRHDDATQCYEKVLALKPDDAEAHVLLGNMLSMLDRHDEAIQCYDKALKPHLSAAKWNKGLLYLSMGRFAEGWELYESRWAGVFDEKALRRYLQPRWDGDYVKGSLLIWGEQGLGDYILFSSMIPELKERADSIVLEVEPRLVKLFARSFPYVRLIPRAKELYTGPVDAHESLAGLGKFLRSSWEAFPRRERGYLFPDDGFAAKLRERLTADHRVVVGLSWSSIKPWLHEPISAPLCDFGALLQLSDCRFVDLQYGDTLAEREMVARETGVLVERLEDVDNTNDLDALAALISACDLVVTISNTTAHLAGALGKPTWVLVPYSKTRVWHWFKGREESPWYPCVRVIRQQRGQPWANLISSVVEEISSFTQNIPHADRPYV